MELIPRIVVNLTSEPITLVDVRGYEDVPIILYPGISLDLSTVALDVDLVKSFHLKHLAALGLINVLATFEVDQLQAGEEGIDNVEVIGTPVAGQVPTATSSTAATWQTPHTLGGVTITGIPSAGEVLTATSSTAADWQNPSTLDGVLVTGIPSTGQVLTATSSTAADWSTPAVTSPGGTNGAIQFNNSGSFAGDASNLFWDSTHRRLGLDTNLPSYPLDVVGDINTSTFYRVGGVLLASTMLSDSLSLQRVSSSGSTLTSLTAANISPGTAGINITGNAATVTTNANLTGDITSVGNSTTVVQSSAPAFTVTGNLVVDGTTSLDSGTISTNGSGNLTLVSGSLSISTGNLVVNGSFQTDQDYIYSDGNGNLNVLSLSADGPGVSLTTYGTVSLDAGAITTNGSGNITATSFTGPLIGTATKATNLAGGAAGKIPFQTAANSTGFTAVGTTGQLLASGGISSPTWTSAPAVAGTNLTGTAASLTAGTVTTNANLTGDVTSVGNATTAIRASGDFSVYGRLLLFASSTQQISDQSGFLTYDSTAGLLTLASMHVGNLEIGSGFGHALTYFDGTSLIALSFATPSTGQVFTATSPTSAAWQFPTPAFASVATDPGSPTAGQVWFNTTDSQFKGYNGAAIVLLG